MIADLCRASVVCALALVAGLRLFAAEIPKPVIPYGVGINIHFTSGHVEDLDKIAKAGFKFIRMDFGWGGIEREKGKYDWSAYDELLGNLERRGIRALLILDYSNSLYEEKITSRNPITGGTHTTVTSPQHPESVAAFAKWAGAAATHFKGRKVIWEIWNEPNIDFWSPKPDVLQYTALALATCKELRKADPDATIIGPATSGFPWDFLESCFKAGLLQYWDAVSVHPYRDYRQPPESAAQDYRRLEALIEHYRASGNPKPPIVSGEWGYATHTKGVSLDIQAAFAARQQLANLMNNIPLSIWYDWKNDGPDPAEREHNFGVVRDNLEPKPAYVAIRTLTTEVAGSKLKKRLPCPSDNDYVLLFEDGAGRRKLAAWTTDPQAHTVMVPSDSVQATTARGVRSDASTFKPEIVNGRLKLELQAAPQYVSLVSN